MRRVVVVALMTLLAACSTRIDLSIPDLVVGAGEAEETAFGYAGFDGLRIESGFEANVSRGGEHSVVVRTNPVITPYLDVTTEESVLVVKLQPGHSYSASVLEVDIVMPDLGQVDASGGSRITVSGFDSRDRFAAMLSGGSRFEGDLDAGAVRFDLSGGSTIDLSGAGQTLDIMASGGSIAILQNFSVDRAQVDISGGGEVMVAPSDTLEVTASGGARVYYTGEPQLVRVDTSGGSEVRPLSA